MFIIEKPSAIGFRNCVIGSGTTEEEAWKDAYGPKPWTPYAKKSARGAWSREVTDDEFYELSSN